MANESVSLTIEQRHDMYDKLWLQSKDFDAAKHVYPNMLYVLFLRSKFWRILRIINWVTEMVKLWSVLIDI